MLLVHGGLHEKAFARSKAFTASDVLSNACLVSWMEENQGLVPLLRGRLLLYNGGRVVTSLPLTREHVAIEKI